MLVVVVARAHGPERRFALLKQHVVDQVCGMVGEPVEDGQVARLVEHRRGFVPFRDRVADASDEFVGAGARDQ